MNVVLRFYDDTNELLVLMLLLLARLINRQDVVFDEFLSSSMSSVFLPIV